GTRTRRMAKTLAFTVAGALAGLALFQPHVPFAPIVSAQQSAATFSSSTRLVVQTVTVKDKDGKPIEGLTAKDFVITEDNEPQQVSFVEFQRLDASATDFPSVVPAAPAPPAGAAPAIAGANTGTNANAPITNAPSPTNEQ